MTEVAAGGWDNAEPRYAEELAEIVRVILVSGLAVGAIVGGLGSRIAMLVLRLTSPDYVRGVESDHGFTIGQVTLGGTYNLMVIGAAVGVIGAAAYLAVAPWLIGPRWFRQATVGATAAVLVGSMLVEPDGVDFTRLQPLWLAIALFLLLPAVVGISLAVVTERVRSPGSWTTQGRARWAVPAVLAVVLAPALLVIVPVLVIVAAVLPARRLFAWLRSSPTGRVAVRAGFAVVPVLGVLALSQDLGALY
ncbi:MAG TPA: hypothetical protein VLK34_06510 [Nocardioidaceae bacterium]|nr:hypothetical protein [Nocardioidaceae bacterium]